ncbi:MULTISPECIES: serine hydrolase domain-containing protein [Brachybacterium]|uniref:serine hydrolase domain-containing protein n=1 Tax=Brachybacterium TaxID=43668 RepID=UPI0006B69F49|nr:MULTISPECIES: serine hydrolase domain-containing protein [Brachybacterium]MCZ4325435.1 serine hydrolase [Brachybacterium paraconglomeratum]GAP77934.1 beta-lactamase [Brachybacterium sp. SW0106-09]
MPDLPATPPDDESPDPHLGTSGAPPVDRSAQPARAMPASRRRHPSRRAVLAAAMPAAAAVVGLTALTAPRPASLGEPAGDEQLTEALAPHLGGHRRVAAILVEDGQARVAGFGTGDDAELESSEFEIGSVSKTFTGALLAVAVERGELATETTVAEVLGTDAEGSAIADVTLAELATHSSGLPRLASAAAGGGGSILAGLLRKDPYRGRDAQQVIADALAETPSGRGEHAYSNLAVALEGQLLATAANTDYATLLTERILEPLGMTSTYAPITAENLRETARRGHGTSGLRQGMWTMDGSAPAGGIRSTPGDMSRYLTAMIDGSAPGAEAATKVLFEESGASSTAMNWFLEDFGSGQPITWHNGMTGGYAAFVGWEPSSGRGLALLSDTARSLDELAVGVLTGEVAL